MDISEIKKWHADALGEAAVSALKKTDFDAVYFADREKAVEFAMGFVKEGAQVGFGGSVTIGELGIKEKVKAKGAVMLDHNAPGLTPEQKADIRRKQQTSDLFFSGSNAVTLDGMILNVDAFGNRTNALSFGPKKVVIIVGVNKICADEASGWLRIREFAAPMNNKRIGTQNPCTVKGVCCDCKGPTRSCRVYSALRRKPNATDITVVVVGESLGL